MKSQTIIVCKSCHWNIHRENKDPVYPAPKHCPLRKDAITITETCLSNCKTWIIASIVFVENFLDAFILEAILKQGNRED